MNSLIFLSLCQSSVLLTQFYLILVLRYFIQVYKSFTTCSMHWISIQTSIFTLNKITHFHHRRGPLECDATRSLTCSSVAAVGGISSGTCPRKACSRCGRSSCRDGSGGLGGCGLGRVLVNSYASLEQQVLVHLSWFCNLSNGKGKLRK